MRQLLNTLFVLSEDAYLSVNGENVVISREQKEVARFPLHTLEGILCFSYAGASGSWAPICSWDSARGRCPGCCFWRRGSSA